MNIAAPILIACTALLCCAPPATAGKRKGRSGDGYFAPDDKETTRIGLHAEGYRNFFLNYKLVSFDRFRQSYNTINAANIASPMGEMRPTGGWTWGGGAHLSKGGGGFYVTYLRSRVEASTLARLNNGDQREMRVVLKPVDINFDMMGSISPRIKVGLGIGMELQNATLYSGYRYAGGPLSYGSDQSLNGIFRGRGDFGITMAARLDVAIVRQLRLTVRGEYVGAFSGKQKGGDGSSDYELLPWKDEMYNLSASGGVHSDGYNHLYMPEDVKNANNEYVYYVGMGSNFAKLYRGWRVSVGIVLDLVTKRIE